MQDLVKTNQELIDELETMRQSMDCMYQRIAQLEASFHRDRSELSSPSVFQPFSQFSIASDRDRFEFPEHPQLHEIFTFIDTNYHQAIGLNEVARIFNYTPSYLTSLVRRLTGKTLYQWIVQRRMFQARNLLRSTEFPICQVAEKVGYSDTGHFVKHFRQVHGQPPNTWKQLIVNR
jgi:AraC-like DNA-binding protein